MTCWPPDLTAASALGYTEAQLDSALKAGDNSWEHPDYEDDTRYRCALCGTQLNNEDN